MCLVDDEEAVGALRAHRADPALRKRVRRRAPVRRAHDLDPLGVLLRSAVVCYPQRSWQMDDGER